jgi:hypothetical protein
MKTIESFIDRLANIPWLANLGKPSTRDDEVFRIYRWQTWPGPEDPGSEMQSAFQMKWKEELVKPTDIQAIEVFRRIRERVLQITKAVVPFEEKQDVWYGPNAAVLAAAFTAGMVGCAVLQDGELKAHSALLESRKQWTLANEWSWYLEGHWPCQYYWPWGHSTVEVADRTGCFRRLVVL